jgi:hypothetical protein
MPEFYGTGPVRFGLRSGPIAYAIRVDGELRVAYRVARSRRVPGKRRENISASIVILQNTTSMPGAHMRECKHSVVQTSLAIFLGLITHVDALTRTWFACTRAVAAANPRRR